MSYVTPNLTVPPIDTSSNNSIIESIGNKLDTLNGNSIISMLKIIDSHLHSASRCYPSLENGIDVSTSDISWGLGSPVEVIPINTINFPFSIYFVNIEGVLATDVYELVFYAGISADEVGRIRTPRDSGYPMIGGSPVTTPIFPANTKISVRGACSQGSGQLTISVYYKKFITDIP
jgi:hypothetical protein